MVNYYRKPVGWRSESYRHYLAAKGIPTRYKTHRYFSKGQFAPPESRDEQGKSLVHSLYAQGLKKQEVQALGISVPESKRREKVIDASQLQIPTATEMMGLPEQTQFTPLQQEPLPQMEPVPQMSSAPMEQPLSDEPELEEQQQEEVSKPSKISGNVEITPGVPPDTIGFDTMMS